MTDPKHLDPIYADENVAWAHFEALRWPDGPECPHCGSVNNATKLGGRTTRKGLYKCNAKECRLPFTATMGTVYESSHIPLSVWLYATHLMCASKKGISAAQLHRMLGFGSYRSAWFMAHRIREGMKAEGLLPLGSGGGVVEADETFYGFNPAGPKTRLASTQMNRVVALVERDGPVRAFVVTDFTRATIDPLLTRHIAPDAHLMTDEAHHYKTVGKSFASHSAVHHAEDEYVRAGDPLITTNTVEGFFGIFKRGMRGIYQHCGSQHVGRYVTEFEFRYNNRSALGIEDDERTERAIKGTVGRRLKYKKPIAQAPAEAGA
jgi:hypothetical protein